MKIKRRIQIAFLTFAMVVTLLAGMSVSASAEPVSDNFLTFTSQEDGSTLLFRWKSGSDVCYRTDTTQEWQSYTAETLLTLNTGDIVQFKGKNVTTENGRANFKMTGKIAASGSVTSLTDGSGGDPNVTLTAGCYASMFYEQSALTAAPELPATTLAKYCYRNMFYCCTGLTAAPALPATTLASYCYNYMFFRCTALISAPELPATTMEEECYYRMFDGCTALKVIPELPATTLALGCYGQMFARCTSIELKTAPDATHTAEWIIPASTSARYWQEYMFDGCTNVADTLQSSGPELMVTYYQLDSSSNGTLHLDLEDGNSNSDLTDIASGDPYADRKSIDQNYNLTVAASTYADKTKVKLEWTTTDINAGRTDNKAWDPDSLKWVDTTDSNTVTLSQNGSAAFTLTNLSSTEVKATASFAQESSFSAPTIAWTEDGASGDGVVTLGTVVQADKSVDTSADHDAVIGVTITPQAADFKALAATSSAAKYGTYTVTLSSSGNTYHVTLDESITDNSIATAVEWTATATSSADYTAKFTSVNDNTFDTSLSDHNIIGVDVSGEELDSDEYTMELSSDKKTVTITIPKEKITGDLTFGCNAVAEIVP